MVEEHERLADDAREEADGAVDAGAAALEVAEAAALEDFELGVWGRGKGLVLDFVRIQVGGGGKGRKRKRGKGEGEKLERFTFGGEEAVERLREDVDDARQILPPPVEPSHLPLHGRRVAQVRDVLRAQEIPQGEDVVEGDGHAAARQGMPHVHRVAQEHHARHLLRARGEPRVGHAPQLALIQRPFERRLHAFRQGR